jgi:hypothetical protein
MHRRPMSIAVVEVQVYRREAEGGRMMLRLRPCWGVLCPAVRKTAINYVSAQRRVK